MVLRMRRGLLIVVGVMGSLLVVYLLVCSASAICRPGNPALQSKSVFPMQVPGTTIVIRNLVNYEGEYMEDGNLTFEKNLAAVCLENQGEDGIECARVILHWENGAYVFDVDMLPAGAGAIVLEKYRSPYDDHQWTSCVGVQKCTTTSWMNVPALIMPLGPTKIHLENPTETTLRNMTLYYKHYLPSDRLLVGGIVYAIKVGDLLPGAAVSLEPERFSWGGSQIVRIAWE